MVTSSVRFGRWLTLAALAGLIGQAAWILLTWMWFAPWFFGALDQHPWLAAFTRSEGADDVSVDPWGVRLVTAALIGVAASAPFVRSRVNRQILWGGLVAGFVAGDLYWSTGAMLRGAASFWNADLYIFVATTGAVLLLSARNSRWRETSNYRLERP